MKAQLLRGAFLVAALATTVRAHVGSPDIYLDSKAGPYQLFVTLRPPLVIPGVAELEVRSESAGVREIRAVPMPMTGAGAKFAPVPDKLKASPQDPQFFTGSLWMMAPGSWQVRLTVVGNQGMGAIAVPVPSAALTTKKMQGALALFLSAVGIFLVAGVIAMMGASVREVKLKPGGVPATSGSRRSRIAMSVAFVIVIAVVWFGNNWWNSEAASYRDKVYKPLRMAAAVDGSGTLTLTMSDPGWLRPRDGNLKRALFVRTIDDLVPDHDHLMHLYVIRQPGLDVVYHLHPEAAQTGVFKLKLPSMPAGVYRLYADIVHANGFPETMVSDIQLPTDLNGRALTGDDASGKAVSASDTTFLLPDGYHLQWLRGTKSLKAKQPTSFRFRLVNSKGHAPSDMRLYMGMLGHAAFVKMDGTVFAHIHPTGSVSMAAFMLAQNDAMAGMDHSAMKMDDTLPNEVSFPYGFPTPGRYRIFVQMKHGDTVETGIFDAGVN
jgi:hypothetical protein